MRTWSDIFHKSDVCEVVCVCVGGGGGRHVNILGSIPNVYFFFVEPITFTKLSHHVFEYVIQSERKVTQPIPDTCSICQKINYIFIRKQKQCNIKCCKCPPRSAMHAFNLFLMSDGTRWRAPVSRKRFTARERPAVDLFGTGESRNVHLNSFWQVK
jgi:hypothetical protein